MLVLLLIKLSSSSATSTMIVLASWPSSKLSSRHIHRSQRATQQCKLRTTTRSELTGRNERLAVLRGFLVIFPKLSSPIQIQKFLGEVGVQSAGLYICRDFNCPSPTSSHADHEHEHLIADCDLLQHVEKPTYKNSTSSIS